MASLANKLSGGNIKRGSAAEIKECITQYKWMLATGFAEYSYNSLSLTMALVTLANSLIDCFVDPEVNSVSMGKYIIAVSSTGLSLIWSGLALLNNKYWGWLRYAEGLFNTIFFSALPILSIINCFDQDLLDQKKFMPGGLIMASAVVFFSAVTLGRTSGRLTQRNPYDALLLTSNPGGYATVSECSSSGPGAAVSEAEAEAEPNTVRSTNPCDYITTQCGRLFTVIRNQLCGATAKSSDEAANTGPVIP